MKENKLACWLVLLILCTYCQNPKKDTAIIKDSVELDEIKAPVKGNQSKTEVEKESYKIVSFKIELQECKKCDIKSVVELQEGFKKMSYQILYNFLCTFDQACSKNIEYSEFSNEMLYGVLSVYPKALIEVIATNPSLNSKYIYEEVSSPLRDYDYDAIIDSIVNIEANAQVKSFIIEAIKKAEKG